MRVSPPPQSCEFIRKIYRPNVFLTIPIVHDRESMSWDTYRRIGKPNRDSDYTMLDVSFKVNIFISLMAQYLCKYHNLQTTSVYEPFTFQSISFVSKI